MAEENVGSMSIPRGFVRVSHFCEAIFRRDIDTIRIMIENGIDVNGKLQGSPYLHYALFAIMLPDGESFGRQFFDVLFNHPNCDITAKDDQGYNILHVVSELNLSDIAQCVLDKGDDEDVNAKGLLDAKDRTGQRPLHKCAAKNAEDTAIVLLSAGADVSVSTLFGVTPLHTAAMYGATAVWLALVEAGADPSSDAVKDAHGFTPEALAASHGHSMDGASAKATAHGKSPTTALVTHELCIRHHTCPPQEVANPRSRDSVPPENCRRLSVLLHPQSGILRSRELSLAWNTNPPPAALSDVLRVHEWSYLRTVQHKCEGLHPDADHAKGIGLIDSDTTVSHQSFNAAMHGAGAVCAGVDAVMSGSSRNAFCPVRPPGHHAGPRGIPGGVSPAEGGSHGFCLLNNISIAAAYAMNQYRETVKKVAIVDFDVHHGNGTEETVRWLQPGVETVEIPSKFGSFGCITTPRYKPWFDSRDPDNVLFVSVHGFGPREAVDYSPSDTPVDRMIRERQVGSFYPGTGSTVIPDVKKRPLSTAPAGFTQPSAAPAPVSSPGQVRFATSDHISYAAAASAPEEGDDNAEDEQEEEEEEEEESMSLESDMDWENMSDIEDNGPVGTQASRKILQKIANACDTFTHVPPAGTTATATAAPGTEPAGDEATPCSGDSGMKPLILDIGVRLPVPGGTDGGGGTDAMGNTNVPDTINNAALYRHQWRNYFRNEIFPRLMTFKPDVLFISAGFDAHKKDAINGGYIALVEEDYEWVTAQLIRISNSCCEGRVVSALEGGYQIKGDYCSAFAKSVKTHVNSLIQGSSSRALYSQTQMQTEQRVEKEAIDKAERKRLEKLAAQQAMYEEMRRAAAEVEEKEHQERLAAYIAEHGEPVDGTAGDSALRFHAVPSAAAAEDAVPVAGTKRRRAAVDYSTLAEQLFGGGGGAAAPTSEQ